MPQFSSLLSKLRLRQLSLGSCRHTRTIHDLYTCRIAVRKPCVLKKPVIQNALGRPCCSQRRNCASRSSSSVYQNPRVADSHEICNQRVFNNKTLLEPPPNTVGLGSSIGVLPAEHKGLPSQKIRKNLEQNFDYLLGIREPRT